MGEGVLDGVLTVRDPRVGEQLRLELALAVTDGVQLGLGG